MAFNVNHIADFFLGQLNPQSGDSITPLKLQKLVYYAQAWHVTIFGTPLFGERVEAWSHGPVVRELWERFRGIGKDTSIPLEGMVIDRIELPFDTLRLLNEVNQIYGEHSGSYLEKLTHSEDPWINARGGIPFHQCSSAEITLNSMKSYYSTKRNGKQRQ